MLLNKFKECKNNKKCLGRGIGSGKGKTCGKGNKGQKSRSGSNIRAFEGGQTPIYKRLPKRGFNSNNTNEYITITTKYIKNFINKNKIKKNNITIFSLKKLSLLKKKIKLIGRWNIINHIYIEVHFASINIINRARKFGSIIRLL